MKRKYKIQILNLTLIIFFTTLIIFSFTACGKAVPKFETFKVERGNIVDSVTASGTVDSSEVKNYSLQVSGKVLNALKKGEPFKSGQVLISVDNSRNEILVSQAEKSLVVAENSLKIAKINYQQALDANHIAVQLADLNTIKAQEAAASALLSLENANTAADASINSAKISIENATADTSINSAKISLENATAAADASIKSAQIALNIAQDSYNAAISSPDSTQAAINTASDKLRTAQATYNQAVTAAQNSINSAQASYEQAKESVQSQADSAEAAYEQAKASAQSQADSAEAAYNQALNNQPSTYWSNLSSTESAETQIKLTQLNISDAALKIKQAERNVENSKQDIEDAKQDLEDYKILAPYDGIISSTGYKVGERSNQGGTGISIISDEFIIKATISENDMPKVKVGNEVVISLDAYSDVELNGTLEKINPVSTTTNGIVSYEVLISFQDVADVELFYGLSANLSIITAKAENVLYVPLQSVYKENGKSFVDVLKTGQTTQGSQANQGSQAKQRNQTSQTNKGAQPQSIEKVEVTTGINDYVNIEIKSGISQGDIIVTSKVTQ